MCSLDGDSWAEVATIPLPSDALIPNLAFTSDGTIGVLYDVATDQGKTTDAYLSYSHDGGITWNVLHLGGPFDLSSIPNGSICTYEELHAMPRGFGAVFALGAPTATEGATDIFFARISF